jgi:AAA15 family ATPase/GTPase
MVRTKWHDIIMQEHGGRLPPIHTLIQGILSIEDDLTRIYCILSYLTGGRISEIVNYQQPRYIKKAKRNKKGETIKNEAGKTIYERVEIKPRKTHPGLLRRNIELEKVKAELKGKEIDLEVVRIVMRNEKNKTKTFKTIYAPYALEKPLIDNLFDFLNHLDPEEVVINFTRFKIYRDFLKYATQFYYPHYIRAIRVGVLLEYYELEEWKVKAFMGWTDLRPLNAYHIFKKDKGILNSFAKKVSEASV